MLRETCVQNSQGSNGSCSFTRGIKEIISEGAADIASYTCCNSLFFITTEGRGALSSFLSGHPIHKKRQQLLPVPLLVLYLWFYGNGRDFSVREG